jgi:putative transposase
VADAAPTASIGELCGLFGVTRQAYYQRQQQVYREAVHEDLLLALVAEIRADQPRIGGRKLLELINPQLEPALQVGRDTLFGLLRWEHLLVCRLKSQTRTTDSSHWLHKYPNLIRELEVTRPHHLWVSDITYVRTGEGFAYLFLVTDAYSRKIVGWQLADSMEAVHGLAAFNMAIAQLPAEAEEVIHHSDRGVEYCSKMYVERLTRSGIRISMTENGDPYENAIAERVNGILKTEWLYVMAIPTVATAKKAVARIVRLYNTKRPHLSVGMLTPEVVHQQTGPLERRWKSYYRNEKKQGNCI